MSKSPILSIIIPTFNQGQYIEACLKSIRNQSFKDFEVLIQDSKSTDETESICRRFVAEDDRFSYFPEKDSGQSDAINRGLGKSRGSYWTWICSDDLYHGDESLAALVSALNDSSTDCLGTFGDAVYIGEKGQYLADYFCIKKDAYREDYKVNWPFSQPSSILKIERVRNVKGVNTKLNLGMDLDLFLKMLSSSNFYFKYIPVKIADVRVHESSKTIHLAKKTMIQAIKLQIRYLGPFYGLRRSIYWKTYKDLIKKDYPTRKTLIKAVIKKLLQKFKVI